MSDPRQSARRRFENGRLVWFDIDPDPAYWLDHWRGGLARGGMAIDADNDELARLVAEHVVPNGPVLEAGCGSGNYVAAFQRCGWPIEGIEYTDALVELVNDLRPELPVRVGDALAIDADDGAYDAYLSFGVIEHRRDGPEPFLIEAHRVLAPGGTAVIAVPTVGPVRRLKARLGRYRDDIGSRTFFQYGFSPAELSGFIAEAGFDVIECRYTGLSRLLDEELPGFDRLPHVRGGTRLRKAINRLGAGRDGHMAVAVARKPLRGA